MLELDPAKAGRALMGIGVASVQLGHVHLTGTVDPYLLSAPPGFFDPETQFVIDLLTREPADVIPADEVATCIRSRTWNPEGYYQNGGHHGRR